MKRYLVLLICLAFILTTTCIYAQPVGNPAKPAILKKGLLFKGENQEHGILIDPEVDLVFDRRLKHQDADTEYRFYGGKAGLVIWDKLFLYGIAGTAEAEQKFQNSGRKVTWDTDYGLAWGGGATLIIYEKDIEIREKAKLRIGLDGRYRHSELDVDNIIVDGVTYSVPSSTLASAGFDYNEWQGALGVSVEFEQFVPYIGVKYAEPDGHATATFDTVEYTEEFGADDNIGIFFGSDYVVSDSIAVYVEGRLIDETALSAGGTIRF
ncbi:MAG: hypothetical protein HQ572_05590 [Candidatus Omnitrophica bacterium]|nr:hypothetical protein [Candidatus Omnitrophota bacterium]